MSAEFHAFSSSSLVFKMGRTGKAEHRWFLVHVSPFVDSEYLQFKVETCWIARVVKEFRKILTELFASTVFKSVVRVEWRQLAHCHLFPLIFPLFCSENDSLGQFWRPLCVASIFIHSLYSPLQFLRPTIPAELTDIVYSINKKTKFFDYAISSLL